MPDDWGIKSPAKLFKLFSGFAFKSTDAQESGAKWLKIANIGIGEIKWDADSFLPEHFLSEHKKFLLAKGDIVVALTRPTLGNKLKVARLTKDSDTSLLNQRVAKIVCKDDVNSEFIFQVLRSDQFAYRINVGLLGTDPPNLSVKVLEDFTLAVPPLPEQRKIAKILGTWDKAIATTEKLIEASKQQKKALMQQLLTGKKRFAGFEGEWNYRSIQDIATRIQRKSDGDDHPILTISSLSGFVTQEERYSRYMAGESVKNYIQLEKGEFAYNKGNSKTYQFGCVFDLETFETGLVPHVYVCFKLNKGLSHRYFKYLFEADYLKPQLAGLVNTGVRNNGLLNIKPAEFLKTTVPVPSYEEQERIADVLHASTEQLKDLESKLTYLKQEKKALMQQLLTGKRRVKPDIEEAV